MSVCKADPRVKPGTFGETCRFGALQSSPRRPHILLTNVGRIMCEAEWLMWMSQNNGISTYFRSAGRTMYRPYEESFADQLQ